MLSNDFRRLRAITRENKDLLRRINIITRCKGAIDTYNPKAGIRFSKLPAKIIELKRYEKQNIEFLNVLLNVQPSISNEELKIDWYKNLRAMQLNSKNPLVLPGLVPKEFDVVEGVESLHTMPATFRQRFLKLLFMFLKKKFLILFSLVNILGCS